MKWFRLYHEIVDDPKVQLLSPILFRHWINILCVASQNDPRGALPPVRDLAFRLKTPERKMTAILAELASAGLVDADDETLRPHNWNGRQRVTDDVAKRVQKHRGNTDVTLHETLPVTDSPLLTETDTDTESEMDPQTPKIRVLRKDPDPPGFDRFWGSYPKHEDRKQAVDQWRRLNPDAALITTILTAIERQKHGRKWQEQFVKAPHRWLRDKNWLDEIEPPRPAPMSANAGGRGQVVF